MGIPARLMGRVFLMSGNFPRHDEGIRHVRTRRVACESIGVQCDPIPYSYRAWCGPCRRIRNDHSRITKSLICQACNWPCWNRNLSRFHRLDLQKKRSN